MSEDVRRDAVHGSLFRPTRDRLLGLAWIGTACLLCYNVYAFSVRGWMIDARTYWSVWEQSPMYGSVPLGEDGAYLYSPAFAQAIWPLTLLPWSVFSLIWLAASSSAYLWLVRPLRWVWAVPLLSLAIEDVVLGNSTWIIALVCAVGLRWSGTWAGPLLTKITPGVGALWFAGTRNLRGIAVAVATALLIVAISVAISPQLWQDWFAMLSANRNPWVAGRAVVAAVVVVVAGRTDRRWWVPLAVVLAAPVPEPYSLAAFCAVPRLLPELALARSRVPFGGVSRTLRRALDLPELPAAR